MYKSTRFYSFFPFTPHSKLILSCHEIGFYYAYATLTALENFFSFSCRGIFMRFQSTGKVEVVVLEKRKLSRCKTQINKCQNIFCSKLSEENLSRKEIMKPSRNANKNRRPRDSSKNFYKMWAPLPSFRRPRFSSTFFRWPWVCKFLSAFV